MRQTFFYLFLAITLIACQSTAGETSNSEEKEDHKTEDIDFNSSAPQEDEDELDAPPEEIGTVYIGTINRKYPITVNLIKDGDEVRGSYYYDKVGTVIELKGKLIEEKIVLDEYDEKGNRTGIWGIESGKLQDWMYGTWTNPKTGKEMSLDLNEIDSRAWKNTATSPWTGVWSNGIGRIEFRIIASDLFYFHHFSTNGRNIGELISELTVKDNIGLYEDADWGGGEDDVCRITYELKGDTLIVSQKEYHHCGAGNAVYFTGKFVREEQYDAYWKAKPLIEKIGGGRIWQLMGEDSIEFLHLEENKNFTWSVEGEKGTIDRKGTWAVNNNQILILNYSESKNTEEWNIDDVFTFSMSMSEGDAEFEFRLFGYQ